MSASEFVFPPRPGRVPAGLTKRELFAAMAMQGVYLATIMRAETRVEGGHIFITQEAFSAKACVEAADALIAELAK